MQISKLSTLANWRLTLPLFLISFLLLFVLLPTEKTEEPATPLVLRSAPEVFTDSLKDADVAHLIAALDHSLTYLKRRHNKIQFSFGDREIGTGELMRTLTEVKKAFSRWGLTPKTYTYLKTNYQFYSSSAEKVLITGYYQARLKGSLKQGGRYQYPLYRKPPDLIRLTHPKRFGDLVLSKARKSSKGQITPYYTREEIDFKGALKGRGLEIVWLDDPIERTFLQIQGSGVVTLDTGELIQIGYADKNGHPYRPIGKYLIEQNLVERSKMSMQAIKTFLKENPDKAKDVFVYDPSYVFFTKRKEGPYGSLSVPVTRFRSIATDSGLMPRGAFALLSFPPPENDHDLLTNPPETDAQLYVMNQDTGGAIRGNARVDLFVGAGEREEQFAGMMQQRGELYFVVKAYESLPAGPFGKEGKI